MTRRYCKTCGNLYGARMAGRLIINSRVRLPNGTVLVQEPPPATWFPDRGECAECWQHDGSDKTWPPGEEWEHLPF